MKILQHTLLSLGGGKKNHPNARNPDYNEALEVLLSEQKFRGASIEDILVDSEKVKKLPLNERRVDSEEYRLPLNLSEIQDISEFRKYIGNTVKTIGRAPNAKGGNSNKKLLIRFRFNQISKIEVGNTKDLSKFHQRKFKNSGPPPTTKRKSVNKIPSRTGFVYVFWLKGLSNKNQNALKVGYTENLITRHKQLNKELHSSVTKLEWISHTYFQFSSGYDAYQFEQDLLFLLKKYLYQGEREIFDLSTDEFDKLLTSNGY